MVRKPFPRAGIALGIDHHPHGIVDKPAACGTAEEDMVDERPPAPRIIGKAGVGIAFRGPGEGGGPAEPRGEFISRGHKAAVEIAQNGKGHTLSLPGGDPFGQDIGLLRQALALLAAGQRLLAAAGIEMDGEQAQRRTPCLHRHIGAAAQRVAGLRTQIEAGQVGILGDPQAAADGEAGALDVVLGREDQGIGCLLYTSDAADE